MKYLLLSFFCLASVSFAAFAPPYQLDDPAIVGKYVLQKPDPKSEVQSAQFYFSKDKKLNLYIDGIDIDLDIEGPDANAMINKDEYEAPDCDHDETACGYVMSTEAYLYQVANKDGKKAPLIRVTATRLSYDEKTKDYVEETATYDLIWSEALPHGGASVYFDKKVAAVDKYLAKCQPLAKQYYQYPSDEVFCPQVLIYGARFSMKEAIDATWSGWLKNKDTRKSTYLQLQNTFFALVEDNLAKALADKAKASVAPKLKAQVAALKAYFKRKSDGGAEFYYHHASYGDNVFVIDAKTKTLFEFSYLKINI